MATSINPAMAQEKKENLDKIQELAGTIEEQAQNNATAEQAAKALAQKSGLASRLEAYQATLDVVELAKKEPIIILTSKNIKQATVYITRKKDGGISTRIVTDYVTNEAKGDEVLTELQTTANENTITYAKSIEKATVTYVKQILDTTRTFEQVYVCAKEQRLSKLQKKYEKASKAIGTDKN